MNGNYNEWFVVKQREMMTRPLYDYSSLSRSHKRKHNLSLCSDSEAIIHTSTLSPHDEDDGKYFLSSALYKFHIAAITALRFILTPHLTCLTFSASIQCMSQKQAFFIKLLNILQGSSSVQHFKSYFSVSMNIKFAETILFLRARERFVKVIIYLKLQFLLQPAVDIDNYA